MFSYIRLLSPQLQVVNHAVSTALHPHRPVAHLKHHKQQKMTVSVTIAIRVVTLLHANTQGAISKSFQPKGVGFIKLNRNHLGSYRDRWTEVGVTSIQVLLSKSE